MTPKALFDSLKCVDADKVSLPVSTPGGSYLLLSAVGPSCPVPYDLARWARRSLGLDAVLLANAVNVYAPSLFIPQHVWAGLPARVGISDLRALSPVYFEWVDRAMREHHSPPFFTEAETVRDRVSWLARLGVTHVLLDPMYYGRLKPVLSRAPEFFRPLYDDGLWAVYEVPRGGRR